MLLITRSSSNVIVLTLTEKVTLTSPYFLFEFKCEQNQQRYYFIAANTSSYTYRYDQFTVTETTAALQDPANGSINLPYVGEYEYRVWEQASSSNLSPLNTEPLETGLARVLEAPATIVSVSSNPISVNQYNYPV
jgi:hypothetical protein